jgi:hypothetical protein
MRNTNLSSLRFVHDEYLLETLGLIQMALENMRMCLNIVEENKSVPIPHPS